MTSIEVQMTDTVTLLQESSVTIGNVAHLDVRLPESPEGPRPMIRNRRR
jgi:hypothetical protein